MKLLIDEMYGLDLAERVRKAGPDAVHVRELELAGAADGDVLARAVEEDCVVVTENAVDFIPLLDGRIAAGLPVTPVLIALRKHLPAGAGAMNHALAGKLVRWVKDHPEPYRHVHWLA